MDVQSLKDTLEEMKKLIKNDDLSPDEKERFLTLRMTAEAKAKAIKSDKLEKGVIEEIEELFRFVNNFIENVKKKRCALIIQLKDYKKWIKSTIDIISSITSEGNSRAPKKRKKKVVPQTENVSELKNLLIKLDQKLDSNIYFIEQQKKRLLSLKDLFEVFLSLAEANPPTKEIKQSLEYLLLDRNQLFSVPINDVFDTPLLTITSFESANKKNFPYSISLITEDESTSMPKTFVEKFVEGFKYLIGDDELTPFDPRPQPLPSHPIFATTRALSLEALRGIDVETLLFLFHFSPNDYERVVAANQLKQREWRFHTQVRVWMKRAAPPQEQTDSNERGDYHLFDWEEKMAVKKISDMTVEYSHLEGHKQFS